jgi:hypothetical protein
MLRISSPAFADGGPIPRAHTCDGADLSPPLVWSGLPEATKELALIVEDPDAPRGVFIHWVLYQLPPSVSTLPAGLPRDAAITQPVRARQGLNDFQQAGYRGPCPPKGPAHRYVFKLLALDAELDVPAGASKAVLLKAAEGHILDRATTTGKYGRGER